MYRKQKIKVMFQITTKITGAEKKKSVTLVQKSERDFKNKFLTYGRKSTNKVI